MRATTTLFVEKGQYYIKHADAVPPPTPSGGRTPGALLYPAPETFEDGGILVAPGTFDGPLSLTVEVDDDITDQDGATWEIVNDASVVAKGSDLYVFDTEDVYDELPRLALAPGDAFHVRLYVRGYEAARRAHMLDPDGEPVEFHLLQVWRT